MFCRYDFVSIRCCLEGRAGHALPSPALATPRPPPNAPGLGDCCVGFASGLEVPKAVRVDQPGAKLKYSFVHRRFGTPAPKFQQCVSINPVRNLSIVLFIVALAPPPPNFNVDGTG